VKGEGTKKEKKKKEKKEGSGWRTWICASSDCRILYEVLHRGRGRRKRLGRAKDSKGEKKKKKKKPGALIEARAAGIFFHRVRGRSGATWREKKIIERETEKGEREGKGRPTRDKIFYHFYCALAQGRGRKTRGEA